MGVLRPVRLQVVAKGVASLAGMSDEPMCGDDILSGTYSKPRKRKAWTACPSCIGRPSCVRQRRVEAARRRRVGSGEFTISTTTLPGSSHSGFTGSASLAFIPSAVALITISNPRGSDWPATVLQPLVAATACARSSARRSSMSHMVSVRAPAAAADLSNRGHEDLRAGGPEVLKSAR